MNCSIIYLKYGELYLKGKNVESFKQKAFNNLKHAINHIKLNITKKFDHIIITDYDNGQLNELIDLIKSIPGFSYFAISYVCNRTIEEISQLAIELLKNVKSFKIEAKRTDKTYEHNSDILKRMIAGEVLKNDSNIHVDIHNPEKLLNIDIRKDGAYLFCEKISTIGGLPVGSSGRCLMLLSGGIDSIVASQLLMKRGMHVDFITFITPPHTSEEALDKVKTLIGIVTKQYCLEQPKLYIFNYTNIQHELYHLNNEAYRITILRRSFLRIANLLAEIKKYDCLATGDALGQVASQTIESLQVIDQASQKIVLRPLISYDKNEIINLAKQLNTYTTSILPYDDACGLFAPANPITKPKLETAIELENSVELLKDLEQSMIDKIDIIYYDKNK